MLSDESQYLIKQDLSCIGCSDGVLIASACSYKNSGFFPSEIEGAANARLIAAAPELLEALARLSDQATRLRLPGQSVTDAEKTALAVIAKATGETK